jgi:hypothetical protein
MIGAYAERSVGTLMYGLSWQEPVSLAPNPSALTKYLNNT